MDRRLKRALEQGFLYEYLMEEGYTLSQETLLELFREYIYQTKTVLGDKIIPLENEVLANVNVEEDIE